MNFSEQVINILDDLSKRFGVVVDWSNENIVPYVQDLYTRMAKYELVTHITSLVLLVIMMSIGIFLLGKVFSDWKKIKKGEIAAKDSIYFYTTHYRCIKKIELSGIGMAFAIAGGVIMIISVLSIPYCIKSIIECVYLPEKVIIDTIKGYLK